MSGGQLSGGQLSGGQLSGGQLSGGQLSRYHHVSRFTLYLDSHGHLMGDNKFREQYTNLNHVSNNRKSGHRQQARNVRHQNFFRG